MEGAGGAETIAEVSGTTTETTGGAETSVLATETFTGGTVDAVTTEVVTGTKRSHIPNIDASENLSYEDTNIGKA